MWPHTLASTTIWEKMSWKHHIGYFINKTVDFPQFLLKILSKITEKAKFSLTAIFSSNQFFSNFYSKNVNFKNFLWEQSSTLWHHTVWKLQKFSLTLSSILIFCISWKLFREINFIVNSFVKKLFSRKFFQKVVKSTVHSVVISEIHSHTFLAKHSWKQRFYQRNY